jgi:hypothetical protein
MKISRIDLRFATPFWQQTLGSSETQATRTATINSNNRKWLFSSLCPFPTKNGR